jgi:hypothetical protein
VLVGTLGLPPSSVWRSSTGTGAPVRRSLARRIASSARRSFARRYASSCGRLSGMSWSARWSKAWEYQLRNLNL